MNQAIMDGQRSWILATFARNRAIFGDLRMEISPEVPPVVETPPGDVAPEAGPNGYPVNVKPADMSPEHQVAYYKHRSHQNETRAKQNEARVKELEPAAAQVAALEEASRTEAEKAALKARQDGEKAGREAADAEALEKFAPRLVGAEFRAQLAGRMTSEQIATLVGGLNVRGFLTADGEPDSQKVADFVAAIPSAPAVPAGPAAPPLTPASLGAGRRDPAKADGLTVGADLHARRHPPKKTATA